MRKYIELTKPENLTALTSDYELNKIVIKVEEKLYQNGAKQKASAMEILVKYNKEIGNWLKQRNITHTQIQRLCLAEVIKVSNRSINRHIQKAFPKLPKNTIYIKTEPSQEAQIDFGYIGKTQDAESKNRKLYAFVVTLSHSSYCYVEFTFSQNQVNWAQLHINAFNFLSVYLIE